MLPEALTSSRDLYVMHAIHIKHLTEVQSQIFLLICQKYSTQCRAFMPLFTHSVTRHVELTLKLANHHNI